MKVVLNCGFGGFCVSEEAAKILNWESRYDWDGIKELRTDKRLIELVEKNPVKASGSNNTTLVVVDAPDECTDWEIDNYDGKESVTFVMDGKIHHIYPEND